MKNCSLSIFRDLYPSISCCMSATRVGQGLGLGLGLGQGLKVRAREVRDGLGLDIVIC